MPGDYKKAMSHKVTGQKPKGWTPIHVLCHGADQCYGVSEIIDVMLENGVADITDFDGTENNTVIFVWVLFCTHTLEAAPLHPHPRLWATMPFSLCIKPQCASTGGLGRPPLRMAISHN